MLLFIFSSCYDIASDDLLTDNAVTTRSSNIDMSIMKSKLKEGLENADFIEEQNDCGPNTIGCINFEYEFETFVDFAVDLSDCLEQTPFGNCSVQGSVTILLCQVTATTYEVIFEEGLVWSWGDCTNEPEYADWDCILTTTTEQFIDVGMPLILDLWGDNGYCSDIPAGGDNDAGIETWNSNYVKQLCVVPCITGLPFPQVTLENCGDSFACCQYRESWCKNDDGSYIVTPLETIVTGECSQSAPKKCIDKDSTQPLISCNYRECDNG